MSTPSSAGLLKRALTALCQRVMRLRISGSPPIPPWPMRARSKSHLMSLEARAAASRPVSLSETPARSSCPFKSWAVRLKGLVVRSSNSSLAPGSASGPISLMSSLALSGSWGYFFSGAAYHELPGGRSPGSPGSPWPLRALATSSFLSIAWARAWRNFFLSRGKRLWFSMSFTTEKRGPEMTWKPFSRRSSLDSGFTRASCTSPRRSAISGSPTGMKRSSSTLGSPR